MPQHHKGEMFDEPGVHIVTGNSFISSEGTLVMSMGAGLSLKERHPELPRIFGAMVKDYCGHLGRYGLLLYGNKGVLQTRADILGKMDPEVIIYGLKILYAVAAGQPDVAFHLNHPGMSFRRSTIPEIDKLLESMPPNVWIWEKE